jgi:hypothetical protein
MNRLLRKFKYTRDLEGKLADRELEATVLKEAYSDALDRAIRWEEYSNELEAIKGVRDISDLTTLAQAVIGYRRALSMLGAADPVEPLTQVETIFEKYNINLPERPYD